MAQVYLALKFHVDHRNRGLVDRITAAFESAGVTTFCVARDLERWGERSLAPDDLMRHAFGAIEDSSGIVLEMTEKGVGLGIEAGYASARGVPVFVIHQPGAAVSTTLRGIAQDVHEYADDRELAAAARHIASLLTAVPVDPDEWS